MMRIDTTWRTPSPSMDPSGTYGWRGGLLASPSWRWRTPGTRMTRSEAWMERGFVAAGAITIISSDLHSLSISRSTSLNSSYPRSPQLNRQQLNRALHYSTNFTINFIKPNSRLASFAISDPESQQSAERLTQARVRAPSALPALVSATPPNLPS